MRYGRTLWWLVSAVVFTAALSSFAHADGEVQAPKPSVACRVLEMHQVPTSYAAFERAVIDWMAGCVTSRTDSVHRERILVRGNRSLIQLWRALIPGQTQVRIVPTYVWGRYRVQRVLFSSPDVRPVRPSPEDRPAIDERSWTQGTRAADTPAVPAGTSRRSPTDRPAPPPTSKPAVPPRDRPTPVLAPQLPDHLGDLLDDADKLADWLRAHGYSDDAGELKRLVSDGKTLLISMSALVGAYYVGARYRAGTLLVAWGWNAIGPDYRRATARFTRLIPDIEGVFSEIVEVAETHPDAVGSAIDWPTLGQLVDPTIPAQLDDAACGPACVQMVLRDRGIDMSQDELIRRARQSIHPEIKSKRVGIATLTGLLKTLDPNGAWTGGRDALAKIALGKTPRQLIAYLGRKGPWIAQVGPHVVVVDGFDKAGYLRIRDPWYEPGVIHGTSAGSYYKVSLRTFVDHWNVAAVYRE